MNYHFCLWFLELSGNTTQTFYLCLSDVWWLSRLISGLMSGRAFSFLCVWYMCIHQTSCKDLFSVISDIFCNELVICLIHCSHLVLFVQFCHHCFSGFPVKVVWVQCCVLYTFHIAGGLGYCTYLINHRHLIMINQQVSNKTPTYCSNRLNRVYSKM